MNTFVVFEFKMSIECTCIDNKSKSEQRAICHVLLLAFTKTLMQKINENNHTTNYNFTQIMTFGMNVHILLRHYSILW